MWIEVETFMQDDIINVDILDRNFESKTNAISGQADSYALGMLEDGSLIVINMSSSVPFISSIQCGVRAPEYV